MVTNPVITLNTSLRSNITMSFTTSSSIFNFQFTTCTSSSIFHIQFTISSSILITGSILIQAAILLYILLASYLTDIMPNAIWGECSVAISDVGWHICLMQNPNDISTKYQTIHILVCFQCLWYSASAAWRLYIFQPV